MQTVVTSTLQAAHPGEHSQSNIGRLSRSFLGKPWEPQLLGSMVTLIWEGYFKKNILPLLKASLGELSEAHSLFKLSATNNSAMPVSRYFEADMKLLGFPVPQVGFLVVRDPNKLLEPQHFTQLPGVISCNLIWLGCEEFGMIHGFKRLEKFQCLNNIHPMVFTQFCLYYHQWKLWGQTGSLSMVTQIR